MGVEDQPVKRAAASETLITRPRSAHQRDSTQAEIEKGDFHGLEWHGWRLGVVDACLAASAFDSYFV